MKQIVVAVVVAWSCIARADAPSGISERVVRFVFDGCDYFRVHPAQPFKKTNHRQVAAHFGRIANSHPRGIDVEYVLATSALPTWEVAYWMDGVDIKVPSTVAMTMGELHHFLGADRSPDVDYALSKRASTKIEFAERVFEPPGHGSCHVEAKTEADEKKGPERRVFALRFWH